MLVIEFVFDAGTYHATPWGRHVNEGEVEWPPSPWRVLRALLSGWYQLPSTGEESESLMQSIIHTLAQSLPMYWLPDVTQSHTRHYMPKSSIGSSTLVFDGFLKIERTAPLVIGWSEVSLAKEETELLQRVLTQVTYLGRAESWATARILTEPHNKWNCTVDATDNSSGRTVRVLAALPDELFNAWKSGFEERESLEPKSKRKNSVTLPETIWESLGTDTLKLERERWSQPPGSRWVTYRVPEKRSFLRKSTMRPTSARNITTARLILSQHKPMPRIQNALLIGELLRSALIKIVGREQLDSALTGHTETGIAKGHHHGFFLPEDADNDGYIDHLIVHASQGLPDSVLDALYSLKVLYVGRDDISAPKLGDEHQSRGWRVALEGYGLLADLASSHHSDLLACSTEWVSATPYLHPWHKKKGGRFGPEEQIRKELLQRGLTATSITRQPSVTVAGKPITSLGFKKFRRKNVSVQPDRQGDFWRITFAEPVSGPLALGFGCHFGLGIFRNDSTSK